MSALRLTRRPGARHVALGLLMVLTLQVAVAGNGASSGLSAVRTRAHAIALTFDDGPDGDLTPRVLSMLEQTGARATFFVTGSSAVARPDLVRLELENGEIGNHTWDHPHLPRMSPNAVTSEILSTQVTLTAIAGVAPRFFRAPYGELPDPAVSVAHAASMSLVRWSFVVDKFRHRPVAAAADAVLERLRPGSILLAHDACPPRDSRAWCLRERGRSLAVLDVVLRRLAERGWRVLTVSELLGLRTR